MEKYSTAKKNHVIPIILSAFIVILIITVLFQNRQISRLENELDRFYLAEKKQPESNTEIIPPGRNSDITSSEKNSSTEADNDCQERLKKLESKIADMQAWQDYLEETMKKEKSGETEVNDRFRKELKPALSSHFEPFFEENNLSANTKSEFIELFIERELELRNARASIANREDFQKERENIETNYDSLLSNLLSEEEYAAYKEYMETEQDRNFIRAIKMRALSGDNQLNKQQEKDLVAAIYNKRRVIEDTYGIKELRSKGNTRNKEDMEKMLAAEKKSLNDYLEAAKDILTDYQMKKFKEFVDLQKSQMEMVENQISQMPDNLNSDTEKAEGQDAGE